MRPESGIVRSAGYILLLLSMPLILGGCFAMQKDLDPIRSDISVLEKQFIELQREQAMLRASMGVEAGEGVPPTGDTEQRLRNLETRVNAIEKSGKPAGYQPVPEVSAPAPIPPEPVGAEPAPAPVMVEPIPQTSSQPPVLVTPGIAPTAPAKATEAAEDIYAAAMKSYKAGDLQSAEQGFRRILEEYPDNRLADNAAYWIGEIQFSRKDYNKAIEVFRGLIADYPIGDKLPDAVYMIGRCYEEMGQTDKAKQEYNRVMDNYPYSEAARNARQRLEGNY